MPRLRLFLRLAAPLALLLAGCGASADVVATYKVASNHLVIEVSASGWGRLQDWSDTAPARDYSLVTPKGRVIDIFDLKGRTIVADAADRFAMNHPGAPTPEPPRGGELFVESGQEKVGAWTGTGYRIKRGCGAWSHIVVLHAPGLEAFSRVVRDSVLYLARYRPPEACFVQALNLIGKGALLYADFPPQTLEKLEHRKIDPARFRPPSRILTRAELFAAFKEAYPGSKDPPIMTPWPPSSVPRPKAPPALPRPT